MHQPRRQPGPRPEPGTDHRDRLQAIPEAELKNGTTPFGVETVAPPTVIAGAPDCPNTNWTEAIDDLAFTSATIVVEQPVGTTVLTVTCSIDPATSDGSVAAGNVSCTQS